MKEPGWLRGLDRRVLGNPRRYDRKPPLWFTFGPLVGAVLGSLLPRLAMNATGGLRVAMYVVFVAAAGGYVLRVYRWDRRHRQRSVLSDEAA